MPERAPFRYNNFGGTIGGPIYVPRFGEGGPAVKNLARTYFFFEELRRDHPLPDICQAAFLTSNMRQGIFPMDVCLSANAPTAATATCTSVLPAGTPIVITGHDQSGRATIL